MWIIKIALLAAGVAVTALSANSPSTVAVNEFAQAQTQTFDLTRQ